MIADVCNLQFGNMALMILGFDDSGSGKGFGKVGQPGLG